MGTEKRKNRRDAAATTLEPNLWQVKLHANGADKPRKKGVRREWTKEEDALVRKWYPVKGSAYLEVLLARPRSSIQHRAERLGIPGTKRPWTRKEELFLQRNYGKLTAAAIARRLNRTEQSVRGKLNIAGLTGTGGQPWTDGEIAYLKKQYGTAPVADLAAELGRTPEAVELKAGRLGLRRKLHKLTKEEKEWIVANLGKMSYETIAKKFGVSPQRIQRIAHASGYRPRPYMREWSEHDVEYLRKHYGKKSRKEIAVTLGRTVATVQMKACKLGLTNPEEHGTHRKWRSHEEEMLKELYTLKTQQEIADMLNRTVRSVSGKLQMMGLVNARKGRSGGSEAGTPG